jgi:hypothetical protein
MNEHEGKADREPPEVPTMHIFTALRLNKIVMVAGLALSAAALACGVGVPGSQATDTPAAPPIDVNATAAALQATAEALAQAETQQAQVPPTAPQLPTAEATLEPTEPGVAPGANVFEDFSTDDGNFETFDGAQISGGEFLLGQFNDCGDLTADSPFGCFSVCLACGVASNYEMSVDVRYVDGISERTYGLVLQFDDVNGNSVVDREDYYVEYQVSAFVAFYTDNLYLRTHVAGDPVGVNSWYYLRYDARPYTNATYGTNKLGVIASKNGTSFDLYLNDNFVDTVNIPNITSSQGLVGLSLSGRRVQVAFDNFSFTPQ